MRLLLDSDVVIDQLSGDMHTSDALRRLLDSGHQLCICDVVIAEVVSGIRPSDREATARFLHACTFLETTAAIAEQAGRWRYDYARQGVTLATTDALIAATASAHDAPLITRNARHYPMPEITLFPLP